MSLSESLKRLIQELDRVHPNGLANISAWKLTERDGLPNFVVAANGRERFFTTAALAALRDFAAIKHENDQAIASMMEVTRFGKIVRLCVADLHAAGKLIADQVDESQDALDSEVKSRIAQLPLKFTHHFPSWTLGMETNRPFVLGPVTFRTRDQWIHAVNFGTDPTLRQSDASQTNADTKKALKDLLCKELAGTGRRTRPGMAEMLFDTVRGFPSILSATVEGYELDLSKRVAEILCKSALDSVSLLLGGKEYFYQQALAHERLPPMMTSSIVETDGQVWSPGSSWGPRARVVSDTTVRDYLAKQGQCLAAISRILDALVDPKSSRHPNLSKRWSTALDWYAEGQRERNDAVALAKIATSLDVLSCGGKFSGILRMLESLLGISESTVIVKGPPPLTLSQVVRTIYERGRSQILHGTRFDRLESFEASRSHATSIARLALLEAAVRLKAFAGPDEKREFRSMPK